MAGRLRPDGGVARDPAAVVFGDGRVDAASARARPAAEVGRRGRFVLVDVKPEKFAALPEVAAVFDWTGRLAAAKGWRYEVWSGAPETVLANVRWLAVGRRADLVDPTALEVVIEVGLPGMTTSEICSIASTRVAELLVKQAVMSLLWSGTWVTDLRAPVSGESIVMWARGAA